MTSKEQAFLSLVALGQYSIDDQGRVWRHMRKGGGSHRGATSHITLTTKRRADTGRARKGSYLRVQFWTASGRRWVAAHRVAWMIHNGREIPECLEVNHKNGNKADNRPVNLEVVTRRQNAIHSAVVLGKRFPGQKLTPGQVLEIRDLFNGKTMTLADIGKLYGVTSKTVDNIGHKRKWAFLS